MRKQIGGIFFIFWVLLLCLGAERPVHAQTPSSQDVVNVLESGRDFYRVDNSVHEYLDQLDSHANDQEAVSVQNNIEDDLAEEMFDPNLTVYIKGIQIEDVSELTNEEMTQVTQPYVGRNLTMVEINQIVQELNKIYAKKGYLLSQITVPSQKIENDVLVLVAREYVVGRVLIEGNRHYTNRQIERRLGLNANQAINVEELNQKINRLNHHVDLDVDVVLDKGEKSDQTDVVLNVKDRMPIHAGISWSNHGHRIVGGENKYVFSVWHNNLTKNDDTLVLELLRSSGGGDAEGKSLAYYFPFSDRFRFAMGAGFADLTLGEEFSVLDASADVDFYEASLNYDVIYDPNKKTVTLSGGFQYINAYNKIFDEVFTKDLLRVAKVDVTGNFSDKYGRSFVYNRVERGIPDIGGGLSDTYDPLVNTRLNSSGEFTKNTFGLSRINRLPLEARLWVGGEMQWSRDALPASQQKFLGGSESVRGYPQVTAFGDKGYLASAELSVPVYFFPSKSTVPGTKRRWYDALRLVTFFDYGHVTKNSPLPLEDEREDLKSAGVGVRLLLDNDFLMHLDWAQGLDGRASDGSKNQTWMKVSKGF